MNRKLKELFHIPFDLKAMKKKRPDDNAAGALHLNLSCFGYSAVSGQSSVRMTIGVERAFGSVWAQFW